MIVGPGGFDAHTTILKGGTEKVSSGGTGIIAVIDSGGVEIVSVGGLALARRSIAAALRLPPPAAPRAAPWFRAAGR